MCSRCSRQHLTIHRRGFPNFAPKVDASLGAWEAPQLHQSVHAKGAAWLRPHAHCLLLTLGARAASPGAGAGGSPGKGQPRASLSSKLALCWLVAGFFQAGLKLAPGCPDWLQAGPALAMALVLVLWHGCEACVGPGPVAGADCSTARALQSFCTLRPSRESAVHGALHAGPCRTSPLRQRAFSSLRRLLQPLTRCCSASEPITAAADLMACTCALRRTGRPLGGRCS